MNYITKKIKISMLICCMPCVAQAIIVDDFKNKNKIFYNADQLMKSGTVNKTDLNAVQAAFKESKTIDSIKTCDYQPHEICKIIIRERMPTIIRLPKYEWVRDWVLGDDINFELDMINGSTHSLSLKSFSPGIDTSLNIIGGSGLIYSFYVLSNSIAAEIVSDFIVNIKANKEILEKIAQAKRFYKDRPIVNETIDDVILINIKNNALHTVFKKVLPVDWNLNIDKKLQSRDRLIDVVSENKTRYEVITDLARNLHLKAIFYPKLRLLVLTTLNPVIE